MKGFWPANLRGKMIILTLLVVTIPMMVAGYIMKTDAEAALLAEKERKLFGAARLLEQYLGGGFEEILREQGVLQADRATQLTVLNRTLAGFTDKVAAVYPGVGAGYYVYTPALQGIVTYGPSSLYAGKVGVVIGEQHPGMKVMQTGESRVEVGPLVRGSIMNAMVPIIRNEQVIGYVWANELTDDIQMQIADMERNIFWSVGVGMALSIILILWFADTIVSGVNTIKDGLRRMEKDLRIPIDGPTGEIGEIAAAINNMAKSLLEARTLTEHIMDSMTDGIITVDNHGVITSINQAAERLTGYAAQEVVGVAYETVFCHGKRFNSLLLDTLRTGESHLGQETDYPVRTGTIHISTSTTRLRNSNEEIIGAVVVFRDLTANHRLEQQVKRADRLAALGELMAGVAHEVRNPLTSIKGFVQYLADSDSEEERREYTPIIIREVDRVNRIIEELLYFARPNQASITIVDVNNLLEQTLVLVKNKTVRNLVEFHLDLASDLPHVEMDAEQFKQVFLNLVINAIQAMPKQGIITIRTAWNQAASRVCISFADTGVGIAEQDAIKIFDPFYTTKETGTGLGLPVVHRIITAHGGQIKVDSTVGQGTMITVTVPLRQRGEDEDHAIELDDFSSRR